MANIFITGASGYIGGEALHRVSTTHPEYSIRALVRNDTHASLITQTYGNVQVVKGSLDDADILAREATTADVVLNVAAAGNLNSVRAIHDALASKAQSAGTGKPTTWIQVSGATVLTTREQADKGYTAGSPSDVVFDDLDGIAQVREIIKQHPARAVDNFIVFTAAETPGVNTALVVPPVVYGEGRGPVNRRSVQVPELAKATIQRGKGLQVGEGRSRWGNVHVQDLGELFLKLVEKAVEGGGDDERVWNGEGVYLTGIGELTFEEVSKKVAATALKKGLVPTDEVEQLAVKDAAEYLPAPLALYGTNARSRARRGRELLGWAPKGVSLEDDVARTVDEEARSLGA